MARHAIFLCAGFAAFLAMTCTQTLPAASPTAGNWTVSEKSEAGLFTCIRLIGEISLDLAYKTKDEKNATVHVLVPKDATVVPGISTCHVHSETGQLKTDVQVIQLSFHVQNATWLLTVNFTKNPAWTRDPTNKTVTAHFARLHYFTDGATFHDVSLPEWRVAENTVDPKTGDGALSMFRSDLAHCYSCNSEESTPVFDDFNISTRNLQVEAFLPNTTILRDAFICEKDKTTTTTVAPTTPTPPPGPKPPTAGNWTVTQEEGRFTCIRLVGDLFLDLTYQTKDDTNATSHVHVPKRALVVSENSTCNVNPATGLVKNGMQTIQLKFALRNNTWFLTVNFTNRPNLTHDDSNQTVTAYYAHLVYFTDDVTFPNVSSLERHTVENVIDTKTGAGALSLFKSDLTHCYRCNSEETTPVFPGFNISTQNLKVEAFLPNRTLLMGERVCLTDQHNETSDLVPIITGAALAGLVLFVLIAYLVGRARAKSTTYETI